MRGREQRLDGDLVDQAHRPVLDALAALVLDHVALAVERLLQAGAIEQEAHAIALQPQRQLELVRGNDLEVVRAVLAGRAVRVRDAGLLQVGEVLVLADMLRALEHDVLEQVREARLARDLVLGPNLEPDVDGHLGHAMVLVQNDLESVRQRVLLERQRRGRGELRRGRSGRGLRRGHGRRRAGFDRGRGRGRRHRCRCRRNRPRLRRRRARHPERAQQQRTQQ